MLLKQLQNNQKSNRCSLAVLVDPDNLKVDTIEQFVTGLDEQFVDVILFGGSLITENKFSEKLAMLKKFSNLPVYLFPGNSIQLSKEADGILFLSLLSGRNAEFLIGQQVVAAPFLKQSGLDVLSTAYLMIDGGKLTTAHYMSNTLPIPNNKPEIAVNTAIAAEFMGFKCIYLDSGSGADKPVSVDVISAIKANVSLPIIVGGGINSIDKAKQVKLAGADMIVIGTAFENNKLSIKEIAAIVSK